MLKLPLKAMLVKFCVLEKVVGDSSNDFKELKILGRLIGEKCLGVRLVYHSHLAHSIGKDDHSLRHRQRTVSSNHFF